MGVMAAGGIGLLHPVRVKLVDLDAVDGLPSERYKQASNALLQSLSRFNCAIIQLPLCHEAILKCVLDSARMFFHQRPIPGPECILLDDLQDWNLKTVGYFVEPRYAREVYNYRPGRSLDADTDTEGLLEGQLPPVGLAEVFSMLGKASRQILDCIGCYLNLQSYCFTELLDSAPLRNGEVSSSVLSVTCNGRPGLVTPSSASEQGHMLPFHGHEPRLDKGLLTLVKSEKPLLHVRDVQGQWILVDSNLGPQDMVLYSGLALYQVTAGYITPASYQIDGEALHGHMFGKCSVVFKTMPRPSAVLRCSAMTAAGHSVSAHFQQPIAAHDFMQRNYPVEEIISRPGFSNLALVAPNAQGVLTKRRKLAARGKPLAPSKWLRSEAQRVLKGRVQEMAERKGIKIRFCGLKECEEQHLHSLDSPCTALRAQLGWPLGVPFVHPHDLPNKAKQAFLEAYEPGWTASDNGLEHLHLHPCMVFTRS